MENRAKNKQKFYDNGLFFGCHGCGNCCKRETGWVEMTRAEMSAAAEFLKMDEPQFLAAFVATRDDHKYYLKNRADKACIFLSEDNLCNIYNYRPMHCQTFPFWPENLKNESRWQTVSANCMGIGSGKFYSYTDIRNLIRQQRKKQDG